MTKGTTNWPYAALLFSFFTAAIWFLTPSSPGTGAIVLILGAAAIICWIISIWSFVAWIKGDG